MEKIYYVNDDMQLITRSSNEYMCTHYGETDTSLPCDAREVHIDSKEDQEWLERITDRGCRRLPPTTLDKEDTEVIEAPLDWDGLSQSEEETKPINKHIWSWGVDQKETHYNKWSQTTARHNNELAIQDKHWNRVIRYWAEKINGSPNSSYLHKVAESIGKETLSNGARTTLISLYIDRWNTLMKNEGKYKFIRRSKYINKR